MNTAARFLIAAALIGGCATAAAPAGEAWQTTVAIELRAGTPSRCAIRYAMPARGLVLSVEKRNTGDAVLTAVAVSGVPVTDARLRTANLDTASLLKPAAPQRDERWRAEAGLEDSDSGAVLMHDLAISGGELQLVAANGTETLALPHPLPREVVAQYLNCAGDLVIPY